MRTDLARPRVGVDLGGTKIEGVLLRVDGRIAARLRVPTPRDDYHGTLEAIADLVRRLERDAGDAASVGIGMPGAISPATGRIKNANSVWLNGRPLVEDLQALLGRELRFANDADCFALSEATDGAARGASSVFGVILGTGVGGGVVIRGRLVAGPNAIAGEWGHNPLPRRPSDSEEPVPPCYCGRTGCIESYLCGPALSREYALATGGDAAPAEIARRAEGGEAAAEAVMAAYEGRLARALASVINLLDPEVIVLGGGLSNVERLYARVPAAWGAHVFSDRVDTRLLPPVHGDSSGVLGAAHLWDA